jgi:hypothetical protein
MKGKLFLTDIIADIRLGYYKFDDDEDGWADYTHVEFDHEEGVFIIQTYRDRGIWDWPQDVTEWRLMDMDDAIYLAYMTYLGRSVWCD